MLAGSAFRIPLCAALCALACPVFARDQQNPQPSVERRAVPAERMNDGERITLDGIFDEPVWKRARPADDFIQVDPSNGRPATEATEVRIAFSDDVFYMAVTCFDSEPDKWIGFQRRRDEFLPADDRFMWAIDTFLDERSGYFFEMNPSGLMADSVFNTNGDNRAWDGIWNARVRHSDIGWTIEIEIPFRTLNFDPGSEKWGINFQRTVRRKNEDSIWMGWARNQGLRRMTNAGHVTGIRDVMVGRGLEVKPYALATLDNVPGRTGDVRSFGPNAGVDLQYNPTPGARASLTVNTDFAQTEVDQRQVNLTQFPLFFPEKRDFFLDGLTYFDFGSSSGGGETIQPYFSRRIGLSDDGLVPQRVNAGGKFTGQMGRQDVGFMHVSTGEEEDKRLIGEEFTVARVKRRMLAESYFGGMYTRRAARLQGAVASQTVGFDFRLATSKFRGSQNLSTTGWYVRGGAPGSVRNKTAYGFTVDYPNDRWYGSFSMREVQRDFNPTVGFVGRRDYRRYNPFVGFGPRPQNSRVRRYQFQGGTELLTDLRNQTLRRAINTSPLQVQFQSQDFFGFDVANVYERLDRPFPISPGITLPFGSEYEYTRFAVFGQTANRRMLALNGRFETGGFYSGDRNQTVVGLTLRARPGYIVSVNTEFNQVDLAEGSFTSNVIRFISDSQFSPYIAIVNNVQYDTVSEVLGWQSRFRWIMKPGNDLYIVYTQNWLDSPLEGRFVTLDQKFASKVLYTHRF